MNDMNNGAPPKPRRRWIWVVLGVVFVLFCIAVGGVIFAVSYFRENMQVTRDVTASSATNEFDAVRAKFPGQQPLIQLVDDRPQLTAERATQSGNGQPLNRLHVLAFDQDSDEMVKFSLPFWLLRMKSGPIRLSAYQQGWDDRGVSFDVKDIEKRGPGIVVDVTEPKEGRVLIWVE
jgi:hypothetical protein